MNRRSFLTSSGLVLKLEIDPGIVIDTIGMDFEFMQLMKYVG